MSAQAVVISSADAVFKKTLLCAMSAHAEVIASAHASFKKKVLCVMSAQAVVTSSAHAGLKNKSFVYYVCTGSSYFFCTCRNSF
jgi:hypothetical protein